MHRELKHKACFQNLTERKISVKINPGLFLRTQSMQTVTGRTRPCGRVYWHAIVVGCVSACVQVPRVHINFRQLRYFNSMNIGRLIHVTSFVVFAPCLGSEVKGRGCIIVTKQNGVSGDKHQPDWNTRA